MMLSLVKADDRSGELADVEVPSKFYNRDKTGIEAVDKIFGGVDMPGILPGSCTLFTGTPGAGKSTMSLQLSDALQRVAGRKVLYNANEESLAMLKMAADRIGVRGRYKVSQKGQVDALIAHVLETGTEVLVQDSLQTLEDGQLHGFRLLRTVCRKLVRLSKDHDVTVIMIGQVTKGGGFAGPMALAHEVDVHAHLSTDKESGNRVMVLTKNRFGPANEPYEFMLTARGLDFRPVEAAEQKQQQEAGMSRQAERRGDVKTVIREKLLAGEMLSGYCFERLGVDCSGGFWRGMLRLVCQEMAKEGFTIMEAKVEGRLHNFLEVNS